MESDLQLAGMRLRHAGVQAMSTSQVVLEQQLGSQRLRTVQTVTGI